MKVVVWKLNDDCWAMYTEDVEVAKEAAERHGLRLMGTYYRKSSGHEPFAWQFAGPRDAVLVLAERKN